jgi:hypothetical protein
MPGTPFFCLQPLPSPGQPPVLKPAPARLKTVQPFLARVQDATTTEGKRRLDRFTEIMSGIINSLIQQGILVQSDPNTWTIQTPEE